MSKQAIKPDTFISQLPTFIKEKKPTSSSVTQEESQLARMAKTAGWRVLREYIEQIKKDMDLLNDQAIANGADFKTIGQNTVVISQTKTVLNKVLNKVEDAREASEKQK